MRRRFEKLVIAVVLASIGAGLVGCASAAPEGRALQWVLENEAEKKRLNDAGFPQFTGPV
jgi:hypothetical protein